MRGLSVGGDYADAFDINEPFSETDRAAFAGWMDGIYNEFIARVSRGRDLPEERVREIARGRVWTGAQARQLGLVDELGGFHEAVNRARVLAEIGEDEDIQLRRFPAQRSPWEELARAFSGDTEAAEALITLGAIARDPEVQALASRVRAERARSEGAAVLADEPIS